MVAEAPVGLIAMLFTDIEGSTRLVRNLSKQQWATLLDGHHEVVGAVIEAHGGWIDRTTGDGYFATFVDPEAAVRAGIASQHLLAGRDWPTPDGRLRVRMGVHLGHADRHRTGYMGVEVHRAARIADAAHGGQLLLSAAAVEGVTAPTDPLGPHRLKDFAAPEPLFCARIDGVGAEAFPAPRTPAFRPTNLPTRRRAVVGRGLELEQIRTGLARARLMTLVGASGTGKTTLAVAAATALLDDHPGGVFLVSLASAARTADDVPGAVAAVLEIEPGEGGLEVALAERLGQERTVVLLDNFEHVLDAAPFVGRLLDAVPGLSLLVTSQAPLRLDGETIVPVDRLAVGEAGRLLAGLAAAARRGRPLEPAEDAAALRICAVLDGIPLAIELAASRLATLSAGELLDRLPSGLDLLSMRRTGGDARMHSLRAAYGWTLALLSPEARMLFAQLGVFVGAPTLRDIQAVCEPATLAALEELAEFSLVRREGDHYAMPHALRQLAAEALDDTADPEAIRAAHARHQLDLAWAARTSLLGTASDYARAAAAEDDAFAALVWARAHDAILADRLAAALAAVLIDRGRYTGARALRRGLEGDRSAALLGRYGEAYERAAQGDMLGASTIGAAIEDELAGCDPAVHCALCCVLTYTVPGTGDTAVLDRSIARQIRAAERAEAAGQGNQVVGARVGAAQALLFAGRLTDADVVLRRELPAAEAAQARILLHVHTLRGDAALATGDAAGALRAYRRSLTTADDQDNQLAIYLDLVRIGGALAIAGRPEDAVYCERIRAAVAAERGIRPGDYAYPGADALAQAVASVPASRRSAIEDAARGVPSTARIAAVLERIDGALTSGTAR